MAGRKQAHLNEEIRQKLALLLVREVNDPHLSTVTVTEVQVAKDLSTARVNFSSYQADADVADLTERLNRAAGFLGHALGRSLTARRTPRLHFHYDRGFDYAQEIEAKLKAIRDTNE